MLKQYELSESYYHYINSLSNNDIIIESNNNKYNINLKIILPTSNSNDISDFINKILDTNQGRVKAKEAEAILFESFDVNTNVLDGTFEYFYIVEKITLNNNQLIIFLKK